MEKLIEKKCIFSAQLLDCMLTEWKSSLALKNMVVRIKDTDILITANIKISYHTFN